MCHINFPTTLPVGDKTYLSEGKVLLDVEEASVVGLQFDFQEMSW